jgi:hypothetical protein
MNNIATCKQYSLTTQRRWEKVSAAVAFQLMRLIFSPTSFL